MHGNRPGAEASAGTASTRARQRRTPRSLAAGLAGLVVLLAAGGCAGTAPAAPSAATGAAGAPATSSAPAAADPSPSPVFPDRAGCVADGGQAVWDYAGEPVYPGPPSDPVCRNVPYIGTDGMTYYLLNVAWPPAGPLDTSGSYAATQAECDTGSYPDANPGVNAPGQWNAALGICQPGSS